MKTTPLIKCHKDSGAKLGEFAGYEMPLYYKDGVMAEHEWVRQKCGIFDVSHMRQILISGPSATNFIEKLTPSSYAKAPNGRAKYTVLTNEAGGIIDDLIVTKLEHDTYFAVINAGCRDKDVSWLQSHLDDGVTLSCLDDRALISIQGPSSETLLKELLNIDASNIPYMWLFKAPAQNNSDLFISRVGYTGEDGFEISLDNSIATEVWAALEHHKDIKPIGLAARDSLRLDMGYCLYGHDIDDKTTPVEAGLRWIIGKNNLNFIGHKIIRPQYDNGADKYRVGIKLLEKGVARESTQILNNKKEQVGLMTSGGFSPSLKESIGQGYVQKEYAKAGTKVFAHVRGRFITAEISALPFIPAKTKAMKMQAA